MSFGATAWDVKPYVRVLATLVTHKFDCSWNTYDDHPPGYGLDDVSVDFWGMGGRGDFLSRRKRRRITRFLRHGQHVPAWRWIINGSKGYYPGGGTFVPRGGAEWNAGHVHITFW